jgi:hypothetical protein
MAIMNNAWLYKLKKKEFPQSFRCQKGDKKELQLSGTTNTV